MPIITVITTAGPIATIGTMAHGYAITPLLGADGKPDKHTRWGPNGRTETHEWTLTHIPSGRFIATTPTKALARQLAGYLAESAPDMATAALETEADRRRFGPAVKAAIDGQWQVRCTAANTAMIKGARR